MLRQALIVSSAAAMSATPVQALCIYRGVDNAKTSLAQEFRDSRWVVRAHVISADYHWSDKDESWTLYRLRIMQSYKGTSRSHLTLFTERNSGGFYLDADGGTPDLDRDYLLFLGSDGWLKNASSFAKSAFRVNYNCGQSRPWPDVSDADKSQLLKLSGRVTSIVR